MVDAIVRLAGPLGLPDAAARLVAARDRGDLRVPVLCVEAETDLIVLGSHRPSMATYFLGSNAKTVARHAKCSVLIVRE